MSTFFPSFGGETREKYSKKGRTVLYLKGFDVKENVMQNEQSDTEGRMEDTEEVQEGMTLGKFVTSESVLFV